MDAHWQELVDEMRGGATTPEAAQDLFESSMEFAMFVDQQIFSCTCCGWWCEINEEASEDHGLDEWTCLQCCEEQA